MDPEKPARIKGTRSVEERLNSKIVQMLENDGRMAFSEIAQKLDVSEGTVRNRVNGMKDAGLHLSSLKNRADFLVGRLIITFLFSQ